MFKHFLLTRFNLRTNGWNKTKNNESVLTDIWHEHRFFLFKNFCFPSVKNQSNQNFIWLVYFDIETPDKYKEKIKQFQADYNNFIPKFINGYDEFLESIKKDIYSIIENEIEYVITTRLDNDDCIHFNFINTVQQTFNKQDKCIIDFEDGYILQLSPSILYTKSRQISNPFISLIEKYEKFETVFSKMHTEWKTNKIISIKNNFLWLQIIHDTNKLNQFRPNWAYFSLKQVEDFNIHSIYINNNILFFLNTFFYNSFYFTKSCYKLIIKILVVLKKKII